jgi:hypothetical protein
MRDNESLKFPNMEKEQMKCKPTAPYPTQREGVITLLFGQHTTISGYRNRTCPLTGTLTWSDFCPSSGSVPIGKYSTFASLQSKIVSKSQGLYILLPKIVISSLDCELTTKSYLLYSLYSAYWRVWIRLG